MVLTITPVPTFDLFWFRSNCAGCVSANYYYTPTGKCVTSNSNGNNINTIASCTQYSSYTGAFLYTYEDGVMYMNCSGIYCNQNNYANGQYGVSIPY